MGRRCRRFGGAEIGHVDSCPNLWCDSIVEATFPRDPNTV